MGSRAFLNTKRCDGEQQKIILVFKVPGGAWTEINGAENGMEFTLTDRTVSDYSFELVMGTDQTSNSTVVNVVNCNGDDNVVGLTETPEPPEHSLEWSISWSFNFENFQNAECNSLGLAENAVVQITFTGTSNQDGTILNKTTDELKSNINTFNIVIVRENPEDDSKVSC